MARKDLSQVDSSVAELSNLDYVLKAEKQKKDNTKYLSVDEAMRQASVYEMQSSRDITRVLFISQDESLLNPTKQSLDGYVDLTELFDEVHILILRTGIKTVTPVLRIAKNLWLYTATDKKWWRTPGQAEALAEEQLVFADGFRADIIVARDPFESALVGKHLAAKYNRPFQIHVLDDFTHPDFLKKKRYNRWRRLMPRFTMPGVASVRTSTKALAELVQQRFNIRNLSVLPRFNNYEAIMQMVPTIDLRDKYKPFSFIMLFIGRLDYDSTLPLLLTAARFGLQNPRIGLIVIGDGPARKIYEDQAKAIGIKEQVVFEPNLKDDVPYLKSANVLVVSDTSPDSDEAVWRGAAAGIPMVVGRTPSRADVFTNGESILMFDDESADDLSLKLNILMNDVPLRQHMSELATEVIKTKFHDDPEHYKAAYRESIEEVLFLGEEGTELTVDEIQ